MALLTCALLYGVRVFGITAGYHRYFSHRTYKTGRSFQFVLAVLGAAAAQQGPLWWAAHPRHHHKYSDTAQDAHSPAVHGFWWSHIGWLLCPHYRPTNYRLVPDLVKYRELRLINRFYMLPPLALAVCVWILGAMLQRYYPAARTSGWQMLVWGFFISTVLVYHAIFAVNSLTHIIGRRRFRTKDESRNSLLVALLTFGEGWHNNNHHYPASERQGFYWWEVDISHYVLRVLCWLRIVWDLQSPPRHILIQPPPGGLASASGSKSD